MVTYLHQMVYLMLLEPSGALKRQYIQLGLALVDNPNESREIKEADCGTKRLLLTSTSTSTKKEIIA